MIWNTCNKCGWPIEKDVNGDEQAVLPSPNPNEPIYERHSKEFCERSSNNAKQA